MVTGSWAESAYVFADNLGVAREQVVVLPSDFNMWSKERAGAFASEVVGDVMRSLTSKGKTRDTKSAETAPLEKKDPASLERLFLENGWTDGLPIVLPTRERVEA